MTDRSDLETAQYKVDEKNKSYTIVRSNKYFGTVINEILCSLWIYTQNYARSNKDVSMNKYLTKLVQDIEGSLV